MLVIASRLGAQPWKAVVQKLAASSSSPRPKGSHSPLHFMGSDHDHTLRNAKICHHWIAAHAPPGTGYLRCWGVQHDVNALEARRDSPVILMLHWAAWREEHSASWDPCSLCEAQRVRSAGPSRGLPPTGPAAWPGNCPKQRRRASSKCRAALSGTVMATLSCPYTCSRTQSQAKQSTDGCHQTPAMKHVLKPQGPGSSSSDEHTSLPSTLTQSAGSAACWTYEQRWGDRLSPVGVSGTALASAEG